MCFLRVLYLENKTVNFVFPYMIGKHAESRRSDVEHRGILFYINSLILYARSN